jgi:hypothetical protein
VAACELRRYFQRDNRCENEAYNHKFHNLDAKAETALAPPAVRPKPILRAGGVSRHDATRCGTRFLAPPFGTRLLPLRLVTSHNLQRIEPTWHMSESMPFTMRG